MMELLVQAERALTVGLVDRAEELFGQAAAADPANAIALVGLARVAIERGDRRGALEFARRALAIDPENVAATRIGARMAEIMETRGEPVPPAPDPGRPARSAGPSTSPRRRGLLDRLRGR